MNFVLRAAFCQGPTNVFPQLPLCLDPYVPRLVAYVPRCLYIFEVSRVSFIATYTSNEMPIQPVMYQ